MIARALTRTLTSSWLADPFVPIGALVLFVERFDQSLQRDGADCPFRHRHAELERLLEVAQVRVAARVDRVTPVSITLQLRDHIALELPIGFADLVRIMVLEVAEQGALRIVFRIRQQQTQRAEYAGHGRNEHSFDAEYARDLQGHHRAIAAERAKRVVPRIASSVSGDGATVPEPCSIRRW